MKLVPYVGHWSFGAGWGVSCSCRVFLNREVVQVISTIQVGSTGELK